MRAKTEMRKRAVARREGRMERRREDEVWMRGREGGSFASRGERLRSYLAKIYSEYFAYIALTKERRPKARLASGREGRQSTLR